MVVCSLPLCLLIFVNSLLLTCLSGDLPGDAFLWRIFESVSARSLGVLLIWYHLLIEIGLSEDLEFQVHFKLSSWPKAQYPNPQIAF